MPLEVLSAAPLRSGLPHLVRPRIPPTVPLPLQPFQQEPAAVPTSMSPLHLVHPRIPPTVPLLEGPLQPFQQEEEPAAVPTRMSPLHLFHLQLLPTFPLREGRLCPSQLERLSLVTLQEGLVYLSYLQLLRGGPVLCRGPVLRRGPVQYGMFQEIHEMYLTSSSYRCP